MAAVRPKPSCFQYPPWFSRRRDNLDFILHCREMLPQQYQVAVEFRSAWLDERGREKTLGFLRDNDLAFVCADGPQGFKSSILPSLRQLAAD